MNPDISSSTSRRLRWLIPMLLGIALIVVVGIRIRLLDMPLERDEGEYAYAGQLILEGIPPYQLVFNMKMPGIYLAYAGVMSLFGQTSVGIHLGLLLVHLATLTVFYRIGRRFLGSAGAGLATASYAFLAISPTCLGLAAHATHFVLLPALIGVLMVLRLEERLQRCPLPESNICGDPTPASWLGAGVFFGIAFLMKQPAALFGVFGGIYLASTSLRAKMPWSLLFRRLLLYSTGCLLPFLGVCLWLWKVGVFEHFWFWTFRFASEYGGILTIREGIDRAFFGLLQLFRAAPLLWILAGLGMILLCVAQLPRRSRIFLIGFLFFSFLAVCPGLYFRPHYFILLLPSISLLVGLVLSVSNQWLNRQLPSAVRFLRPLLVLLILLACLQSLYIPRAIFFTLTPRDACSAIYGPIPFPDSLEIARYIENRTTPGERIVVIGSEPQIYFYAHRHSSSGHIYAYHLMEDQPFAMAMQEEMIREIEQNPPAFLVFVDVNTSWGLRKESSDLLINWAEKYAMTKMSRVGLIQMGSNNNSKNIWGADAATVPIPSTPHIEVYQKIDLISARIHGDRGAQLLKQGRVKEAILEFEEVLNFAPGDVSSRNNLAWILSTTPSASLRDGPKALKLAQQAANLTGGKSPEILDTLGAAYAETGDYSRALESVRRALKMAELTNNKELCNSLRKEIALYESGKPLHDP